MVVAGEPSGDLHLSKLVQEMGHRTRHSIHFFGIAGPRTEAVGGEIVVPMEKMAVMGIVEIFRHFPFLYGVLRRMRRELRDNPPDMLLLVDYPGFNLLLAKSARKLGIPVLYYIGPQLWAWRSGRIHKISRRVDHMAVIFPFEVPYYAAAGIPVRFVGHPLVGKVVSDATHEEARIKIGIDPDRKTIGLFPGSRIGEVERVLGDLLKTAEEMLRRDPDIQFVLSRAPELPATIFSIAKDFESLPLTVVTGDTHTAIQACDVIATVSGTVTLEIALLDRPLVVVYKTSSLSYWVLNRLIRIPSVSLVNIVAEREVVPELLQEEVSAKHIVPHLVSLLDEGAERERMMAGLKEVRDKLGDGNAASNLADWVEELLDNNLQIAG